MWGMVSTTSVYAQDDYEIQVYGAETVEPHRTMVDFHSNFAIQGSKEVVDGVLPTEHAWHETIEITRGFNSWFETGFYIFYEYSTGERLGLGGRPHPAPVSDPCELELACGR